MTDAVIVHNAGGRNRAIGKKGLALLEQMARHLAVPAPTLERMLQRSARQRPARPASADGAPAPAPAAPPSKLEQAEHGILACLLADPRLLERADLTATVDLPADARTLVGWAAEGLALGRTTSAELMRYLMTRAAEQPALQALLGSAFHLATKTRDPAAVLTGLLVGRRRLTGDTERRSLRQQLQDAIAVGDQTRAAELQHQLLARLREDRPRHNTT